MSIDFIIDLIKTLLCIQSPTKVKIKKPNSPQEVPVKATPPEDKPKPEVPAKPTLHLVYFKDVVDRYGTPYNKETQQEDEKIKHEWEQQWMSLWRGDEFEKATGIKWPQNAPFKKIYCNKDLIPFLNNVFVNLIKKDLFKELKKFDGCWCIRKIRGRDDKWSIHTFALAVDFNAEENPLGGPLTFSKEFLQCWRDAGWTCGADFSRIDGMHFQIVEKA